MMSPAAEPPRAPPACPRPLPNASNHGSETILVVEDEPSVRFIVCKILTRLGYDVISAESGTEAVHLATNNDRPIHLLLTDMVMPVMNGIEVASTISRLIPGIKIMLMSGFSDEILAESPIAMQGIHFLQKPYSAAVLAEKVRSALEM